MRFLAALLLAAFLPLLAIAAPTAYLSWSAVTTYGDGVTALPAGAVVTYNLYQATPGTNPALILTGLTGTNTTVTAGLTPGTTQCWYVSSVYQGVESSLSLAYCWELQAVTAGTPGGLTASVQ